MREAIMMTADCISIAEASRVICHVDILRSEPFSKLVRPHRWRPDKKAYLQMCCASTGGSKWNELLSSSALISGFLNVILFRLPIAS